MKYKSFIFFLFFISCVPNNNNLNVVAPYTSKGFAYIYDKDDFTNKIIKDYLDSSKLQIAHNTLRPGSLIKIINPKTKDFIILKINKKAKYPDFYKILITKPIAKKLNLNYELPFVELIEIKKNKSFIAKKTEIYNEEKKIHSNAPVEIVKIDNISKIKIKKINKIDNKIYIVLAEFYSRESASLLKKRITKELTNFDIKKIHINVKKTNEISLLSGPYNSINSMKNDYIQLKNFGFEELDITINE